MQPPPLSQSQSLETIVQEVFEPLDSLSDLLIAGGYHDAAVVTSSLVDRSRAKMSAVVRCLEDGCGHGIVLQNFGGVFAPEKSGIEQKF